MAQLVDAAGRIYPLRASTNVLGRRGADINFVDAGVAPRHAEISFAGGRYWIQDLAGTTSLNAGRIHGRQPLRGGDAIALGGRVLTFHDVAGNATYVTSMTSATTGGPTLGWGASAQQVAPIQALGTWKRPSQLWSGYASGQFDALHKWKLICSLATIGVAAVAVADSRGDTSQALLGSALAALVIVAGVLSAGWRRFHHLPWPQKVVVLAAAAPGAAALAMAAIALLLLMLFAGGAGKSGASGNTAVDSGGKVYKKSWWSGEWEPQRNLLGNQVRRTNWLGQPVAKQGLFGPVEKRTAWGTTHTTKEGAKLYEDARGH